MPIGDEFLPKGSVGLFFLTYLSIEHSTCMPILGRERISSAVDFQVYFEI